MIGKIIASVIMLLGYGIIAVPTGIVTAGIMKSKKILVHKLASIVQKRIMMKMHYIVNIVVLKYIMTNI